MNKKEPVFKPRIQPHCCPNEYPAGRARTGFTRRTFLKGMGGLRGGLDKLRSAADFPVEFLPLSGVCKAPDLAAVTDLAGCDAILLYAAGGWVGVLVPLGGGGKGL